MGALTIILAILAFMAVGFVAVIAVFALIFGALHGLLFAADYGLIGVTLYVAAWIFLPVVMTIISVFSGLLHADD